MSCAGTIDYVACGRHGWIRRHGICLVPAEARRAIALGIVTVPGARAPLVFAAIAADPEAWLTEIARRLALHPSAVRRSADLLERDRFIARRARAWLLLRTPGPSWRDYALGSRGGAETRSPPRLRASA